MLKIKTRTMTHEKNCRGLERELEAKSFELWFCKHKMPNKRFEKIY